MTVKKRKITSSSGNIFTITMIVKKKGGKATLKQATVLIAPAIGDSPVLFNTFCCPSKTVGGVLYHQVPGNTEGFPSCHADCVYEQDGAPGSRYCFKPGKKEVQCIEQEIKFGKVGMTFSERPGSSGSTVTDWIAFKTSSGVLKCDIGFDLQKNILDDIVCSWGEAGTEMPTGNGTVYTIQSEDNSI